MVNFLFSIEDMINNRILRIPRQWLVQAASLLPLRLLIVTGVLLFSIAVPFKASIQQLIFLFGLIIGVGGLFVLLQWPSLGFIGLTIIALIVPSPDLPGGLNVAVLFLMLLIGLWLLDTILGRREILWVRSRTVWPLLALISVVALSFAVGQLPWFSFARAAPLDAQLGGLAIFVLAAGAFLLAAHQVRDLRWLEWTVWVFLALAALHLATWLVPSIGPYISGLFQRGTGNNSLFWVWLIALALSQAVFNKDLHLGWRLVLGGLVIATLYKGLILNSDWKSGYLPPLVTVAAIIGLRSWRTALAIALIGIIPAIYIGADAIASDEYSYLTRIDAWQIMLEIIKVNPILGFGPANYYWYTPLFPIRGYYVSFNSHNQYLDIIAQAGLLGLACFMWFVGETGLLGWRLRDQTSTGFARAYVYGAFGGLAGMVAAGMLADWTFPFVYNIGFSGFRFTLLAWIFLGGLISVEQIVHRQTQSQT